ncbi:hypothetical protein CTI12_AA568520 [Artemisia annua]|uniref:Uncharacterized protein n=1 Tax=Artemisia annua TaxID=35608 RepID=A0A2U1KSZ8_ARTAN|nr:hypothetical protein CTI12_AA568520 [Artemisia annua]
MSLIDYDLALLIQPMLMLGISTGVALNVMFADWMVTVLLIILFIGTSTKSFRRGVDTWRKETIKKKVRLINNSICIVIYLYGIWKQRDVDEAEYKLLPGGPGNGTKTEPKQSFKKEVRALPKILSSINCQELYNYLFNMVLGVELVAGKRATSKRKMEPEAHDVCQVVFKDIDVYGNELLF